MTSIDVTRATESRPGSLPKLRFPTGFVWGAATAAYQIEGAVSEDGRTPSIWDTFSHLPGKVLHGHTGDIAVDHYHRYQEDVALMADLGLMAYRFSIAWPRIVPAETGKVNARGVAFYQRLVDALLARGIAPVPTLYHWDLPQWLQDKGGWLSRETPRRFADYAEVVGRALGDRVDLVATLNEPWCSAFLGHATGYHAPGLADPVAGLTAAHHLNLAHGRAATALRATMPQGARVSLVLNPAQVRPASGSAADRDAARAVDAVANRIFTGPVFHGDYPADLVSDTSTFTDWSFVRDGDLAAIHQPPDVLGVNYYTPAVIQAVAPSPAPVNAGAPAGGDPRRIPDLWPATTAARAVSQEGPRTGIGWTVDADAFTDLLVKLSHDHPRTPLMVTENGAAYPDVVEADGEIRDTDRTDYLHRHIAAVHQAIERGADVRGYFAWTLMDNFEWAWGYSQRFGLIRINYENLSRTPKQSAQWFKEVIAQNAIDPGTGPEL